MISDNEEESPGDLRMIIRAVNVNENNAPNMIKMSSTSARFKIPNLLTDRSTTKVEERSDSVALTAIAFAAASIASFSHEML